MSRLKHTKLSSQHVPRSFGEFCGKTHAHPLLYLKGVKFNDLQSVLNFMYHGEVNVAQEELNSFLSVAEELHVKGLTQGQQSGGSTSHTSSQNAQKTSSSVPAFKPRPPDPPQRSRTIRPPQEVREEVEEVPMPSVKSEVVAQAEYEEGEEEEEEGNYQEDYGEQFLGESGQDYTAMQPHDPTKGDFLNSYFNQAEQKVVLHYVFPSISLLLQLILGHICKQFEALKKN